MTDMKPLLGTLVNGALALAGAALMGVTVWKLAVGEVAAGATAAAAGLLAMIAATVDRFEYFKGLGIEAKTRKLEQKIDEADRATARLKNVVELTGAALVALQARAGRGTSTTPAEEAWRSACAVRDALRDLGSNEETIRSALKPWADYLGRDIAQDVPVAFSQAVQQVVRQRRDTRDAWPGLVNPSDPGWIEASRLADEGLRYMREINAEFVVQDPARSAQRLRQMLVQIPSFAPAEAVAQLRREVEEWAPRLEHLSQHHELVEPDKWFARHALIPKHLEVG